MIAEYTKPSYISSKALFFNINIYNTKSLEYSSIIAKITILIKLQKGK